VRAPKKPKSQDQRKLAAGGFDSVNVSVTVVPGRMLRCNMMLEEMVRCG
jgi:hypothetical protein